MKKWECIPSINNNNTETSKACYYFLYKNIETSTACYYFPCNNIEKNINLHL